MSHAAFCCVDYEPAITSCLARRAAVQVGESWNALAHIRQAVTFLVIHQKHRKSFREITEDLCSSLSVQQLYRISTMYWDDRCARLPWRRDKCAIHSAWWLVQALLVPTQPAGTTRRR